MPDLVAIASLRPTQFTLGMREVERRTEEIAALGAKKREDYVRERPVPCVQGLEGRLFIIDRHHMCRALLAIGAKEVRINMLCAIPSLDKDEFWTFMDLRGWVHPFDNQGRRRPISDLPLNIADLADDPYRALAGFLRRDEGFKKDDTPFEEFIWADFLRRRVDTKLMAKDFNRAKAQALTLAHSEAAAHLPGWKRAK